MNKTIRYFLNTNDGQFMQIEGTTKKTPFSEKAGWVEIEPEAHAYLLELYNAKNEKKTPLRDRDILTLKIVDWSDDEKEDEPAIDVEIYTEGIFDAEQSKVFSIRGNITKSRACELARSYAAEFVNIGKLSY